MADFERIDHILAAIDNLTVQFAGTNVEQIAAAFAAEINEIEAVLAQLDADVWLGKAVGEQLDGIGQIVDLGRDIGAVIPRMYFGYAGQPAAGGYGEAAYADVGAPQYDDSIMSDDEYTRALRAKVFVNTGNCSIETVVQAVSEVTGVDAVVSELGNAHYSVEIPTLIPVNVAGLLTIPKVLPKAGGVRLDIIYYDRVAFGYADQFNAGGYGEAAYLTEVQADGDAEFRFDSRLGGFYRSDH